jgi:FkbM family methyltransferase
MNVGIIKYDGFEILLGNPSDEEQFRHNRAAFAQVFLAGNYNPLLKRIKMDDIVIDAGANIGMFSLLASRRVGNEGKVIAVEPQKDNFNFLEENIRMNELKNIRTINRALYSEDDQTLSFEGIGVSGHLSSKKTDNSVATISLGSIVSELSGQNFWIKMDIEGGEEFVFALNQDLSYLDKMNGIAYEIHSREGLELLNGQLVKLGFRPSKVFYEHDFIHDIWRGFLRHPIIFSKLYTGSLFNIAGRILDKRNSTSELECAFEPGMQYAWRDDTV